MLFGINKVGRKLHFVATLAVALGTFLSAFWILSVNSWMQTPVGYEIAANGQFVPGPSWWVIVFNPSFPYRLVHTVLAAYLTTAFRSEEHTSELQSLMRISYDVFCLKTKTTV